MLYLDDEIFQFLPTPVLKLCQLTHGRSLTLTRVIQQRQHNIRDIDRLLSMYALTLKWR